jgi:hypothetical protein
LVKGGNIVLSIFGAGKHTISTLKAIGAAGLEVPATAGLTEVMEWIDARNYCDSWDYNRSSILAATSHTDWLFLCWALLTNQKKSEMRMYDVGLVVVGDSAKKL